MTEHLLSAVIFVPLLGALIALFAPEKAAKVICTIFAVLAFAVSIPLATGYSNRAQPTFKTYVEKSVLPGAFNTYDIVKEPQQKAALARLEVEEEVRFLDHRI